MKIVIVRADTLQLNSFKLMQKWSLSVIPLQLINLASPRGKIET